MLLLLYILGLLDGGGEAAPGDGTASDVSPTRRSLFRGRTRRASV